MKPSILLVLVLAAMTLPSLGQEYVSESAVTLNATILIQGADASVTTVEGGTTITTKKVVSVPYTNRDLLTEMETARLISSPLQGWNLVLRVDSTGVGGLYVRKLGSEPVAVPAELLTLPEFGARVAGGITVRGAEGTSFGGLSETAFATLSVRGIPASGLASSTMANTDPSRGPVSTSGMTALTFAGGVEDAGGSRLVSGSLEISSDKSTPATK